MTIEFRCTQCEKLLRTPDGTGGKTAKCPQCGAMLTIPGGTGAANNVEELLSSPAQQPYAPLPPLPTSQNPYQSPMAPEMQPGPIHDGTIRRGFNPTKIDLGDVMSSAWRIFKANLWWCVGTSILATFLTNVVSNVGSRLLPELLRGADDAIQVGVIVIFTLASMVFGVFINLGFISYMIKVARGEDYSVAELFSKGALLGPGIAVALGTTVAIAIGYILLIIPGIILSLMLAPTMAILIDQRTSIADTFRYSYEATKGNKLTILGLFLVSIAIMILSFLALCIGFLFAIPYIWLIAAVAYLKMTGQSTADEGYATL